MVLLNCFCVGLWEVVVGHDFRYIDLRKQLGQFSLRRLQITFHFHPLSNYLVLWMENQASNLLQQLAFTLEVRKTQHYFGPSHASVLPVRAPMTTTS
jgi:hypothetical protein